MSAYHIARLIKWASPANTWTWIDLLVVVSHWVTICHALTEHCRPAWNCTTPCTLPIPSRYALRSTGAFCDWIYLFEPTGCSVTTIVWHRTYWPTTYRQGTVMTFNYMHQLHFSSKKGAIPYYNKQCRYTLHTYHWPISRRQGATGDVCKRPLCFSNDSALCMITVCYTPHHA